MKNIKKIFILVCVVIFISINLNAVYSKESETGDDVKNIYLTFDDGPSKGVTENILDVLKENDIKATFFVVGKEINGREEVLKRIYAEGHSIGIHTYSHNFKKIYKSEEIFIEEMEKTAEQIKGIVGVRPTIIRFPGGSKKHLNESFLDKLHSHNFKVYDWNKHISDGLDHKISSNTLFREATKDCEKVNNIVLLMHCGSLNKNTCRALPNIIKFYKENGYEFKAITEDTPEIYFRMHKSNIRKEI